MKHLALIFLFLVTFISYGQYDTAQVDGLISKLYDQQIKEDTFYHAGLFRTQREWKEAVMEDNTFFYTASICYLLQNLRARLSRGDQVLIDTIRSRAKQNAWRYANRKGEASYNFWQTNPDTPHPNGKQKHQKEEYGLPDDLDDSVIIGAALQNDSINKQLRSKMIAYATSNNHKSVRKAPKGYRKTLAYRTWFADKWAQDLDLTALCNVLQFVFENGYELNTYDYAAIQFISDALKRGDHFDQPENISPYYGRTAVILYHLARTLDKDDQGRLDHLRQQVINDLTKQLEASQNEFEKVMVLTSLYRLGQRAGIDLNEEKLMADEKSFYLYYATSRDLPLAGYKRWIIDKLNLVPNMYWKSSAFNTTLLLEFAVESGYSFKSEILDKR